MQYGTCSFLFEAKFFKQNQRSSTAVRHTNTIDSQTNLQDGNLITKQIKVSHNVIVLINQQCSVTKEYSLYTCTNDHNSIGIYFYFHITLVCTLGWPEIAKKNSHIGNIFLSSPNSRDFLCSRPMLILYTFEYDLACIPVSFSSSSITTHVQVDEEIPTPFIGVEGISNPRCPCFIQFRISQFKHFVNMFINLKRLVDAMFIIIFLLDS